MLRQVQGRQDGDIHGKEGRGELPQQGKRRTLALDKLAQRLEIECVATGIRAVGVGLDKLWVVL
jgi:hypothetical protein